MQLSTLLLSGLAATVLALEPPNADGYFSKPEFEAREIDANTASNLKLTTYQFQNCKVSVENI